MSNETVLAYVTLKSRSGLSIFNDFDRFTFSNLNDFRPRPSHTDQVENKLGQAGFDIEALTEVGISFSTTIENLESEFGVTIQKRIVELNDPRVLPQQVEIFEASMPSMMSNRIADLAEVVQLVAPGVSFHNVNHPNPNYYFLDVVTDVPTLINVNNLHANNINGSGVRVSMVDTGFITRVSEDHVSNSANQVTVNHTVRAVQGVWLATDNNHTGTNYFTGGSFAGTTLTLGTPLPSGSTNVEAVYSCIHPHYTSNNYTIDDIRAVGGEDVNRDEIGHGTAMAANVLSIAPECTFSFVKGSNLAGFQAAVQNQNPDIITCSWGSVNPIHPNPWVNNALHVEIANAVANGIVVIFAAGNGHTDDSSRLVQSMAHPKLISVGGAYPIQAGGFRASNYASSYDSFVFTGPQRHSPDVVGLVGETPRAVLIMFPTEPGDIMDGSAGSGLACGLGESFPNCDETGTDDGWCACSGTSASAPQTAGVAALLLQQIPNLGPEEVKHILENSARDITTGNTSSAGPDAAAQGWDAATGFGLIDGQAALNFLQQGVFNAYIRDSVEDDGTEPVVANRLYTSPDIIVRQSQIADLQDELGQTVKHRYDLSDDVELGQDNFIYLRVQNRGRNTDNCSAKVYFTAPGMFANPTNWDLIGQLNIQNLKPGEFRVVGPLIWQQAQVSSTGHYCLISILDSTNDPAPNLSTIHTTDDFVNMVRNKNNVAWKNIDIKDLVPGGFSSFSFYMTGPSGTGHKATLEIDISDLPANSETLTKVVKRLAKTATLSNLTVDSTTKLYNHLKNTGNVGKLIDMEFGSNERSQVTIHYKVPSSAAYGSYKVVATLTIDGDEVGKYTEFARVFSYTFIGNRRSRELHRRGCTWERKMNAGNRVPFGDLERAHRIGYDNCAYCLGGSLR